MKEYIATFFAEKPHFGILLSFGGFGSSILGWFHIINIVFAALGALIGFAAAVITFLIKLREWKRGR